MLEHDQLPYCVTYKSSNYRIRCRLSKLGWRLIDRPWSCCGTAVPMNFAKTDEQNLVCYEAANLPVSQLHQCIFPLHMHLHRLNDADLSILPWAVEVLLLDVSGARNRNLYGSQNIQYCLCFNWWSFTLQRRSPSRRSNTGTKSCYTRPNN